MASLSGPMSPPMSIPVETEVRSDPGLDPMISVIPQTSKRDRCHLGFGRPKTARSELMGTGTRDASVRVHTISSHAPEEEITSPLRLALARRSVKKQIFTYMDQGDKKTDIESRTGLSHQCIKWHRWLWRSEGCHPRPRSEKPSKSSSQVSRSPSVRSQRSSKKRPACDGKGELAIAGESGGGKRRRRKQSAVGRSRSNERHARAGSEMGFAEKDSKGSSLLAGKENVPEKEEAMVMSGEVKVLPIRELRL